MIDPVHELTNYVCLVSVWLDSCDSTFCVWYMFVLMMGDAPCFFRPVTGLWLNVASFCAVVAVLAVAGLITHRNRDRNSSWRCCGARKEYQVRMCTLSPPSRGQVFNRYFSIASVASTLRSRWPVIRHLRSIRSTSYWPHSRAKEHTVLSHQQHWFCILIMHLPSRCICRNST